MPKSMTGFGRGEITKPGQRMLVEMKSVNNRYCDIQIRMPRLFFALEADIKRLIASSVSRGKIDVFITYEDFRENAQDLKIDLNLIKAYKEGIENVGDILQKPTICQVKDLLRIPGLFQIEKTDPQLDEIQPILMEATSIALDQFISSRQIEANRLQDDLNKRIEYLSTRMQDLREFAPKVVELYQEKLNIRLEELLGDQKDVIMDEQRLAAEMVLFADRSNIDEELTRLSSHIALFQETIGISEAPVGKKLDFIMQELNREVNTIGSKANNIDVTNIVVDLKTELEKIREQIQNFE